MSPEDRLVNYRCALIAGGVSSYDAENAARFVLENERPITVATDEPRVQCGHGPRNVAYVTVSTSAIVVRGWVHPAGGFWAWYIEDDHEKVQRCGEPDEAISSLEKALRARLATLTGLP